MIEFRYLLSGVGYISRETTKKLINNPQIKISSFKRYKTGLSGATVILVIKGKTHQLDIQGSSG